MAANILRQFLKVLMLGFNISKLGGGFVVDLLRIALRENFSLRGKSGCISFTFSKWLGMKI